MQKLSIVIPVKNGMPYIRDALHILNETRISIEIIISDNFSDDGTANFLSKISDSRVKIIKPDKPLTAAENWTFVSSKASGEYTKLLCADDTILENGLINQVNILDQHPEVQLVASRRSIIDSQGNCLINEHGLAGLEGFQVGRKILRESFLNGTNILGEPSAILFRTKILQNALPWNGNHPFTLDFELYTRILMNSDTYLLNSIDSTFRVHGSSTSARNLFQHFNNFNALYRTIVLTQPEFTPLTKKEYLKFEILTFIKTIARWLIFSYSKLRMKFRFL